MAGLDRTIIAQFDHEKIVSHVKADIRSDFILAPHFNAVFNRASGDLWDYVTQKLRSGEYQPDLPITISVPKERFFTRPGSILKPADRILYQALIDNINDNLEGNLDRTRSFSHVPSEEDSEMFRPNHECWNSFQEKVNDICNDCDYIIKADISNYFERLPHHHLINLISAANCTPEIVNLIEELLLSFRERISSGIVQGVFPSDILGNFFLSDFDAYCELSEIPSARYVDDIYMGYHDEISARNGLSDLIETLRKDGLHLNEYKSKILTSDDVVREETEIDTLFSRIRDEIDDDNTERYSPYGFEVEWEDEDDEDTEGELEPEEQRDFEAVKALFNGIEDHPDQKDKIEKFCLPILRSINSEVAVDYVLENLTEKPHQTRLFLSYLSAFSPNSAEIRNALENLVRNERVSDYQKMYLLAALLRSRDISRNTVNLTLQWLQNPSVAKEARAMAAIFAARHGTAQQKRAVRTSYEGEQADYVRGAILYAARYLPTADRRTCKRAWGGHSPLNTLIARTI